MKKMKVVTVVGTRPEVIRLSRVIAALDKNFNHTLIHTGQNHDYELILENSKIIVDTRGKFPASSKIIRA